MSKYSAEARLRDALLNAGVLNPEPLIDGFREEIRADYVLTRKAIKQLKADALRDVQKIFEKSAREGVKTWDPAMVSCVIGARAAKFEQEALNTK